MAGLKGMCTVCNKPAEYDCRLCGRPFCKDHIDQKSMLCESCRKGRKA